MWGVDTIPTSARWMVGETRSISVSSSVTLQCFFLSLQTQTRKSGTYNTKRQEYLDSVIEEFKAFDPYKLDRIWAIMLDNLRSTLKNRGGNDYEPEHTRKRKSQKDAGTTVDLTVPMEDYHECVILVREYRQDYPIE